MNWKLKCAAFYGLKFLPRGAYDLLQKYVTGRNSDVLTYEMLAAYRVHVDVFRTLPSGATAIEFGSGRNLLTPLLLSAAGAAQVLAIDISRLATVERVNNVIQQLRQLGVPGNWREIENIDSDLWSCYRIRYVAPGDARSTQLGDGSVDFVCSTSVLEHIPVAQIRAILAECRRVCRPGALLSMIIDYHDHYATSDANITRFNFYKYSDSLWPLFNPDGHYQNRLRHSDFESLFVEFETLRNDRIIPSGSDVELGRIKMNDKFAGYAAQDLLALNGVFTLKNVG